MISLTQDELLDIWHDGKDTPLGDGRVANKVAFRERERDSYDIYGYGDEDIWLVFRVGETYYKQYGYQDSYGSVYFDGGIRKVQPTIKTIEVWD